MADEVTRRLVHASGAVVPGLYLADLLTWAQMQYVLVAAVVVTAVLETVRLGIGLDWVVFERLTREYEQDNLAGYALYVFSGSVTGLLFRPEVAVPAILILTLADPISGLLGSDELRTVKRPHALTVMFAVSTGIAVAFVSLPAAVLGGIAATLADGVKPVVRGYVVDDNLTIPIVTAVAITVGLSYLPGA